MEPAAFGGLRPFVVEWCGNAGSPGLSSAMFGCCCTEKEEAFDSLAVDEKETKLVKSTPALGKATSDPAGLEGKNCYLVTLPRASDGKPDLAVEKSDSDYLMIKKITPAVVAWNENNPTTHQIGVFDRIVEVNGQAALGKDLGRALETPSSGDVSLLLQRPQTRALTLKRPGKLGIIANYMPNYSLKPWIDTVADGLVDDWNKANPDACVREHDRIMSVNGVSHPPEEVVLQMRKQDESLEIVVMHYVP